MIPQCFPTAYYFTATLGLFSADPQNGRVRLMEHGVDLQLYVVVCWKPQLPNVLSIFASPLVVDKRENWDKKKTSLGVS